MLFSPLIILFSSNSYLRQWDDIQYNASIGSIKFKIETSSVISDLSFRVSTDNFSSQPYKKLKSHMKKPNKGDSLSFLSQLAKLIVAYFTLGELMDLCFELRLDYETIPGLEKTSKARGLTYYMARNNQIDALLTVLKRNRPVNKWPEKPEPFDLTQELKVFSGYFTEYSKPEEKVHSPELKSNFVTNIPQILGLFVGREEDVTRLKAHLGVLGDSRILNRMIIRGWPGVGKTVLMTALSNDHEVKEYFSDGILWTTLGQNPNPANLLSEWARLLKVPDFTQFSSLEEGRERLRTFLKNRKSLLIIDDVWNSQDAAPLFLGGDMCFTLITTRFRLVADQLASIPNEIYWLELLTLQKSLELFSLLAPRYIKTFYEETKDWLDEIERLPLAILVGARLLEREMDNGKDRALELLKEIDLMRSQAPLDRYDPEMGHIPTLEAIFKKSTDLLDENTRIAFAILGGFAAKPATFDIAAMKQQWDKWDVTEDSWRVANKLIDFGLLEPIKTTGRFQMHALLVMHARSLLAD